MNMFLKPWTSINKQLKFLCVNILTFYEMVKGGEGVSKMVLPDFINEVTVLLSSANPAIGSVQSMAVVINVAC